MLSSWFAAPQESKNRLMSISSSDVMKQPTVEKLNIYTLFDQSQKKCLLVEGSCTEQYLRQVEDKHFTFSIRSTRKELEDWKLESYMAVLYKDFVAFHMTNGEIFKIKFDDNDLVVSSGSGHVYYCKVSEGSWID